MSDLKTSAVKTNNAQQETVTIQYNKFKAKMPVSLFGSADPKSKSVTLKNGIEIRSIYLEGNSEVTVDQNSGMILIKNEGDQIIVDTQQGKEDSVHIQTDSAVCVNSDKDDTVMVMPTLSINYDKIK